MEFQVHGVHLREVVHKSIVNCQTKLTSKINGHVRNIKNKPIVEVKLVSIDDVFPKAAHSVLEKAFQKEFKIDDVNSKYYGVELESPVKTSDFSDDFGPFTIFREDELSEMVWALQGAGREFRAAIEVILERDQKKKDALLKATMSELTFNCQIIRVNREKDLRYQLSISVSQALLNNVEGFDHTQTRVLEELATTIALCNAYNSAIALSGRAVIDSDIYLDDLEPRLIKLLNLLKSLSDKSETIEVK